VAATTAPVLIGGESGSGKELAAQAIHRRSSRAAGPFVAVNCGAIAPSLLHAELFGHERGAFTGASSQRVGLIEAANHGTVFLDEIGDLPLDLQTSLLRFLQEKTIHRVGGVHSLAVNVRVVAASHVDLAAAVRAGRFREDLYYRLSVLPIDVPALRSRLEDLPMLAEHFLRACQTEGLRRIEGFRRRAMDAMLAHSWPGNVRELSNRVRRAVVMSDDYLVGPDDLGLTLYQQPELMDLDAARTMAEREVISAALARVGRNVTHAARALGISRMTLYRLMDKHRIASCAE
jgi:two-component system response regulator HydG